MTKLSNLQIIKRAASMGYSAVIKLLDNHSLHYNLKPSPVVNIDGAEIRLQNGEYLGIVSEGKEIAEDIEITGFIYAGHLFGEPKIEEGQRFRVKETGEVGKYICSGEKPSLALDCVRIETNPQASFVFSKSELEPVFD